MTKSPRWGSVLASAATATVLVATPLATAGAAYAQDPYPPHSTTHPYPPKPHHPGHYPPKPHHPGHYPPKPHKPHGPGYGDGHNGNWPHQPGYGDGYGDGRNGGGHRSPHLANTGDDNTRNLVLGSTAAGLIAAGAGTLMVVRRRHNS
ncbi:LPXTG cell wall anchor domain-containing protein [Streptomyces sp. NPDC056656]|uniref:LPXTG cell wall anchor domain-containing protein n=1 Tax=Streptomyces sp. NPDC056656 TaxID=3345895 RepID=UPI0036C2BC3E